jgi:hypothetical protein
MGQERPIWDGCAMSASTPEATDCCVTGKAGVELLKPAAENVLQNWPVSKRVNSSRAADDDPTLIDRVTL